MRDSRRLQERVEVRLERMQLIWLTLGVVVALALVFALGVLVGKRAARLAPAGPGGDPIAQIDEKGELHEELTFYDKLTSPSVDGAGRPHAAVADRTARPAAPREAAPQPRTDPQAAVTPAPSPAPPAPEARTSDDGSVARAADPIPATGPAEAAAVAPPRPASKPTPPAARQPAGAAGVDPAVLAELAKGPAHRGEYTVQVSSFQTSDEAKAYAASLERKGYRPFVVAGQVKGKGTWYRVRIGSFRDPERAKSAKMLLARSDIPAWILKSE